MRIIAGELGGRRIAAPPGQNTRPMLDRVREALFSRIQGDVPGARVLDLFSGSGSLGLEALSRGAAQARLVEQDRKTLVLLEQNVSSLGVADRAEIVRADALAPSSWTWPDGTTKSDLVFVDAPYRMCAGESTRGVLLRASHELVASFLDPDGVVVVHAPKGALARADFRPEIAADVRTYGSNDLWFLGCGEGE